MIPLGYMAKFVRPCPDGFAAPVQELASVSPCLSPDFGDWLDAWRHNDYWLFDSPARIVEVARQKGVELAAARWFYYEGEGREWDGARWRPVAPEPSLGLAVEEPHQRLLRGFDVVSYAGGSTAECSPLSCNGLAERLPVNASCLFDTAEEALRHIEQGAFDLAEPGPYRLMAVYEVEAPPI